MPKFWKVSFRDWSDKYHFEDRKYEAKIISKDPLLLQVDIDISLTSDVYASPSAEEPKPGDTPKQKPPENSITIRVTNPNGKPIKNANIFQYHVIETPNGKRLAEIKYFTDADGEAVITRAGKSKDLRI